MMEHVQRSELILANARDDRFVDDAEHRDDGSPFGLSDELGDDTDVLQSSLSIGETHGTVQEVDLTTCVKILP